MGELPKGQRSIDDFPRFGLQQFQYRFPDQTERVAFDVDGDVEKPLRVEERFLQLPRTTQVSDLHCVTTWSKCRTSIPAPPFKPQLTVANRR